MIPYDRINQQFSDYRLLRLLGQSGLSEVYLGEHVRFRTQAAVKLLGGQRSGDDAQKFIAQASTLAHLQHPHIIPLLDFGIDDGLAFLIMGYAPNGTLRQRHPKGTRVPLDTVVTYVKQVAEALQYVHQRQLVHRDIKPHNMLLGANNEIMLSDFGIAVISQSFDPLHSIIHDFEGTIPYSAPEQLQGQPRRGSDQYALGIVVYEWLSGHWPFSGTFDVIAHQHLFTPPPSLQEKGIAIEPAIEQVIMRTLEKEPEKRFPSIMHFSDALEQASPLKQSLKTTPEAKPQPKRQFMSPLPFSR